MNDLPKGKSRKHKNHFVRKVVFIVLILTAFFVGVLSGKIFNKNSTEESVAQIPKSEENDEAKEINISEELVTVSTPYGDLGYSVTWKDMIFVEENDLVPYRVTFYGTVGDKKAELFSVSIGGDADKGRLFGNIDGENVYISVAELATETWSEEEIQTFNTLQEEVNSIIGQIYELADFEPVD